MNGVVSGGDLRRRSSNSTCQSLLTTCCNRDVGRTVVGIHLSQYHPGPMSTRGSPVLLSVSFTLPHYPYFGCRLISSFLLFIIFWGCLHRVLISWGLQTYPLIHISQTTSRSGVQTASRIYIYPSSGVQTASRIYIYPKVSSIRKRAVRDSWQRSLIEILKNSRPRLS